VSVVEMDGKLEDIKDFVHIDKMIAETAAKVPGELSSEIIKVRTTYISAQARPPCRTRSLSRTVYLTPYLRDHPKVGANSPGALDGTGLFQTLTALKLREFYESVTGKKVRLRTA